MTATDPGVRRAPWWFTMLVVVLALSSGAPGRALEAAQGAVAPEESSPQYAQARSELAPLLPIHSEQLSAVTRYRLAILSSRAATQNDPALCAIVISAIELTPLLAEQLSQIQGRLLEQGDTQALDTFTAKIQKATTLLPGIGLVVGTEGVRSYVDYRQLAQLFRAGPVSRDLLQTMGEFSPAPLGWPVYLEPQTDLGGCSRPTALLDPVRRLGQSWQRGPACLKEVLEGEIVKSVSAATTSSCMCSTRTETSDGMHKLAAVLKTVGLAKAEAVTNSNVEHLPERRFECKAGN